jgi:Fur family transcriptional regulator, ferric uptake regulator
VSGLNSIQVLKKHNLRNTPFRLQVADVFVNAEAAITLKEIEKKLKDFDRITLYRTLKSFEQQGVIHKIASTGEPKYALCQDKCEEDHHHHDHIHFHCDSCAKTFCVDVDSLPGIKLPENYSMKELEIIVKGTCSKCNN